MNILCCRGCGKMYKARKHPEKPETYLTDFNDELTHCINCGNPFTVLETEDWIADLVFSLKGK